MALSRAVKKKNNKRRECAKYGRGRSPPERNAVRSVSVLLRPRMKNVVRSAPTTGKMTGGRFPPLVLLIWRCRAPCAVRGRSIVAGPVALFHF
ncbi:hypothetical protein NDU88_003599 [Pleurodeles waltl]|uniref:Uncharacterized protein n=1 Tax=Pleurodeles waltl TaxID=8319 RepID=A0AAV7MS33_PLEWA|nr:hypothetical protein NDU88_003599 [Pleurodeles waltl]